MKEEGDIPQSTVLYTLLKEEGDIPHSTVLYTLLKEEGDIPHSTVLYTLLNEEGDIPHSTVLYTLLTEEGDIPHSTGLYTLLKEEGDIPHSTVLYTLLKEEGDIPQSTVLYTLLKEEGDVPHSTVLYTRLKEKGDIPHSTVLYTLLKEEVSGSTCTTFHAIRCKSYRYMNSFFPDAIASWNLFMEIFNYKFVPSLRLLKNDIISLIRPESKSFFKIHDPTGLRYIFQLRVRLSPLKGHKYCHKFIDTPSGTCQCNQGIEDTRQFLLSCPFYTVQRVTLVTSVKEILLKVNLIHLRRSIETVYIWRYFY